MYTDLFYVLTATLNFQEFQFTDSDHNTINRTILCYEVSIAKMMQ